MVFIDDFLPDPTIGLDDSDETEEFALIEFFADQTAKLNEISERVSDELNDVEENLVDDGSEDDYFLELPDPTLGLDDFEEVAPTEEIQLGSSGEVESSGDVIVLGADSLPEKLTPQAPVRRRRIYTVEESLKSYSKVLTGTMSQLRSQGQNDKHSKEIQKRLVEFYDYHNDIFPSVMLSNEFYAAVKTTGYADDSIKDIYKRDDLSNFIIAEIRRGRDILSIIELLKEFFLQAHVVNSKNQQFLLTAMNEAKALAFLNKLKSYHETELASYEKDLSTRNLTQVNVDTNVNRFISVTSSYAGENALATRSKQEAAYPTKVYLDSYTFICGNAECGSEERYEYPFLKAIIINSPKDDFLTLIPTLEICTNCGAYNFLPANYYTEIVKNIRTIFKQDFNTEYLKNSLSRLSSDFTRYSYELPRSVLIEALPSDLKTLYEDRGAATPTIIVTSADQPLDLIKASSDYKKKISTLMQAKSLSFDKLRQEEATNLVSINLEVSRLLAGEVYASLTKMLCTAIGSDYKIMKEKAINSLLFFLEDYIPFMVNPFTVVREYATNLVGLMEDEAYQQLSAEYEEVKAQLDQLADYLAFVPITVSESKHKHLEEFIQDNFMKNFLNYVSDAMILFSMKEELVDLCIVGQYAPFLPTKTKLKSILTLNQRDSHLKKFNKSLNSVSGEKERVTQFLFTSRNWIVNKWSSRKEHKLLLHAFLSKDIYDVMQIVYSKENQYPKLRESLDSIKPSFEGKNKLEFYYGDLFVEEDFEKYSAEGIDLFYIVPREEGEDLKHYLEEIRAKGSRLKHGKIKHRGWFSQHVGEFFEILKENRLSQLKEEDVLFMDILKSMTVYGPKVMAQAFSLNDNILNFVASDFDDITLPTFDKEKEFAKQLLYQYPYTNSTLQLMIAECISDDVDTIVSLLLSEPNLLEEEFASAPAIVKNTLSEQFGLEII